ncbi:MAG: hypothetical protein WA715_08260 [Candidatus Acidiferrum sp.]
MAVRLETRKRILSNNVVGSPRPSRLGEADGNGDYAMGLLDKKPVLVLSQTCDSQNKDFIQVAPILPVGQIDAEELANLKNGGVMNAFWLAPHPPEIPEQSFANLTLIQSIHNTYIRHVHSSDFLRNSISG